MEKNRHHFLSHFGSLEQTVSASERREGTVSAFPTVIAGDQLPELAGRDPRNFTSIPLDKTLVIEGQGLVAIRLIPGRALDIILSDQKLNTATKILKLELTDDSALFRSSLETSTTANIIPSDAPKGIAAAVLVPGVEDTYWLSLDKENGCIRYGRGYRSASVTRLVANIAVGDHQPFAWVKVLKYIEIRSLEADVSIKPQLKRFAVGAFPIVRDLPPLISDPSNLTLEDIDTGASTSIANLGDECQRLYANVAGPAIVLNDTDFREFSNAIEWSIRTPNKICWKMLEKKRTEFGNDPKMTYLRITLGLDEGNSPGVPFVMEIWPAGHYSPIHNHADAYAIIKVLYGTINASYFTRLDAPRYKFEPDLCLKKGQVTWISPDCYQVHQLHNDSNEVCVTIQCYQYAENDKVHDENFHYIKDGVPYPPDFPFKPNSDCSFLDFKKEIKKEWEEGAAERGRGGRKKKGKKARRFGGAGARW